MPGEFKLPDQFESSHIRLTPPNIVEKRFKQSWTISFSGMVMNDNSLMAILDFLNERNCGITAAWVFLIAVLFSARMRSSAVMFFNCCQTFFEKAIAVERGGEMHLQVFEVLLRVPKLLNPGQRAAALHS